MLAVLYAKEVCTCDEKLLVLFSLLVVAHRQKWDSWQMNAIFLSRVSVESAQKNVRRAPRGKIQVGNRLDLCFAKTKGLMSVHAMNS